MFAHLSTTVFGLTTIRTYNVIELFRKSFMKKVDRYHANMFAYDLSLRWVGFYMDLLGTFSPPRLSNPTI